MLNSHSYFHLNNEIALSACFHLENAYHSVSYKDKSLQPVEILLGYTYHHDLNHIFPEKAPNLKRQVRKHLHIKNAVSDAACK